MKVTNSTLPNREIHLILHYSKFANSAKVTYQLEKEHLTSLHCNHCHCHHLKNNVLVLKQYVKTQLFQRLTNLTMKYNLARKIKNTSRYSVNC